jgi:AmmeMemoRadiSam system protein B/AmmeMemoRadiSam system protein A
MKILLFAALIPISAAASAATRPPAVAGAFYLDDPERLRAQVEALLPSAVDPSQQGARALVVPHAGYVYSGAVAGEAFTTLDTSAVRRVILLGPSHHRRFKGGALPARNLEAFATPLGDVPLDSEALKVLRASSEFGGPSDAHAPEHCLEVELPFLQLLVPNARIVPILLGAETDREGARRIARELTPLLDDGTVVVVSSDFTHHGQRYGWAPLSEPDLGAQLVHLGRVTAGRLAAIDPQGFWSQVEVSGDTVCGAKPAAVLAELLAHAFEGSGEVLDVTTSGHLSGRWDLSVTYASVAFRGEWRKWRDEEPSSPVGKVTAAQGAEAVALARATLESFLLHDGSLAEWYASPHDAETSRALAGAFVTLNNTGERAKREGRLRACMGVIEARQPLEDAVVQAAVWAARDPRFPHLQPVELEEIEVEVSVLSAASPVVGPEAIEVGVHGVILTKGGKRALFLPQVAPEQGWDRDTMLDHLARKAGLPSDGWRHGARFEVFTAQVFGESHEP